MKDKSTVQRSFTVPAKFAVTVCLLFALSTSSFGAVYARLHYYYYSVTPAASVNYNSSWGGFTEGHTTITVELFSDAACTIPTTSTQDISFQLNGIAWYKHVEQYYYLDESGGSTGSYVSVMIPAGYSTFDLGTVEDYKNETEFQEEGGFGYDFSANYVLDRAIYYYEIDPGTTSIDGIGGTVDNPKDYAWPSASGY